MGDFTRIDWNRQKGESNLWYGRFLVYRNMGSERQPLACFRLYLRQNGEYTKAEKAKSWPGSWDRALIQYNWRDRAEAFDAEERRVKEAHRKRYVEQLDEEAHKIAVDALKKAKKMLDWPLARTEIEDNGKTHVLIPAGWNQNTAIRMLEKSHLVGLSALGISRSGAVGAAQALQGAGKTVEEDDPIRDMEWLKDFTEEEEVDEQATQTDSGQEAQEEGA
jgi:hypothetical protein